VEHLLGRQRPRRAAARSGRHYTTYGERKPVVIEAGLSQMPGPVRGAVTLPSHLDWSGHPVHDLDLDLDDPSGWPLCTRSSSNLPGQHT
jgi:hypothetical protein